MKTISSKLTFYKYLTAIGAIFFLALLTKFIYLLINGDGKVLDAIIVVSVFETICLLCFFMLIKLRHIEFDDNNLYVSHNRETQSIPLGKVEAIKLTTIEVNSASFWKIIYRCDERFTTVRLVPNTYFEDFIKSVQKKNPDVLIRKWAFSI